MDRRLPESSPTASRRFGSSDVRGKPPTPCRWCSTCPPASVAALRLPGRPVPDPARDGGRLRSIDGATRCRPPPSLGEDLRITVKRDRDGVVSNWLNDNVARRRRDSRGPPAGPVRARGLRSASSSRSRAEAASLRCSRWFARRSPATSRRVRLFYANRSRDSVIFADALERLAGGTPGPARRAASLRRRRGSGAAPTRSRRSSARRETPSIYICGPAPFMDAVEATVLAAGVRADRMHLERFRARCESRPTRADVRTEEVTIVLDRRTTVRRTAKATRCCRPPARLA